MLISWVDKKKCLDPRPGDLTCWMLAFTFSLSCYLPLINVVSESNNGSV